MATMMTPHRFGPSDPVAYFALARPAKLACRDLASGAQYTYRELDARIERLAGGLEHTLGAGARGARIASLARNSVDLVCLYLACQRAGAVYAPLNWRLGAAELSAIARRVEPSILVFDQDFEAGAAGVFASAPGAVGLRTGQDFESLFDARDPPRARRLAESGDISVLLCTSGTTGNPKAVMVSEANAQATALNYSSSAEIGPASVMLCNMPLFHVVGLFAVARTSLQLGATLLVSPRFDAAETMAHIASADLGVTHYFCAPQMAQMMREAPSFDPAHFRRLTALQTGGAPNRADSVRAWLNDGVPMVDGFGMSEAGTVLGMPPGDLELLKRKAGSAGLPAITIDIRLVDREGRDVEVGETGEIWIRGPSLTSGYWRDEDATRAAFHEGWFKSGDAARRDEDGFYAIVDRWKDMYVSGGENVYPAEIEAALVNCPGLADAAIVGVPDPRWGETGIAFIVRAPGAGLTAEHVLAHCRNALAGYKAPKHVVFLESLPRTASGKLQKNLLRQQWTAKSGDQTP
jgi:fatty-acyl-CoA synthase